MTVRIVCEGHLKPHRVIEFERRSDASKELNPWSEVAGRSFPRDRRIKSAVGWDNLKPEHLELMDSENPQYLGKRLIGDRWFGTEADAFDPSPHAQDELTQAFGRAPDAARDVYPIKCDRCQSGRDRRAERLYPVLDALQASGRTEVTVREFWAVADEMDSPRRR